MATRKKRRRRKTRHRTECRGTKLLRTQFRRRKENYRRVSASKRRQRRMLRGRAEERPEGPGQHLATPTRCPSCCTPRGRRGGCTAHICRHYIKRASVMRAQTPRLCACLSARSWIASSAARYALLAERAWRLTSPAGAQHPVRVRLRGAMGHAGYRGAPPRGGGGLVVRRGRAQWNIKDTITLCLFTQTWEAAQAQTSEAGHSA